MLMGVFLSEREGSIRGTGFTRDIVRIPGAALAKNLTIHTNLALVDNLFAAFLAVDTTTGPTDELVKQNGQMHGLIGKKVRIRNALITNQHGMPPV